MMSIRSLVLPISTLNLKQQQSHCLKVMKLQILQCCQCSSSLKKRRMPSFVDYLQIQACGGAGGQGLPKYGGFGGDGGKVIVMASSKVLTLKQVLQKYPRQFCKAGTGENSERFHLLGGKGPDLVIEVPAGVLVHKTDGIIVDLNKPGDVCVVSEGGSGGNQKTNFLGLKGEQNLIALELKLLADVGLVGFPNAGKSTFLKSISKAKPRVGAYPFTTLSPQLGVMEYEDGRKISVADLPGLIEGSHKNFGMGIKFLRHCERNKLLLYVVDINPFQLSFDYPERSAFETLLLLIQELDQYGHGMLDKPSVLTLNKIDTDSTQSNVTKLLDLVKNLPDSLDKVSQEFHPARLPVFDDVIAMSAMKKENILMVKDRVREVMDDYAERRRVAELETRKALMDASDDVDIHREHLKTILV